MRIDITSLAFGYKVNGSGATPNWATALGQGKDHKINIDPSIDEIMRGMLYSSVSLDKIQTKIGKGGKSVNGTDVDSPILMASVFSRVYVNDTEIPNSKFILIITRDASDSHAGRLRLKYGPSNTYNDGTNIVTNANCFDSIVTTLGLATDACWFVSDISIVNQNELHMSAVIVNKDGSEEYSSGSDLHSKWDNLISNDIIPSAVELINRNFYGIHIKKRNSAISANEVNIGWSGLGDLTDIDSKEKLSSLFDSTYPDAKFRSKAQAISQIWSFVSDMNIGDIIIFGDGSKAHIGLVESNYYYEVDPDVRDEDYCNNRKVKWLKEFSYKDLPKVFKSALASARTLFSLNAYKSIILELLENGSADVDDEDIDFSEAEIDNSVPEQKPKISLNYNTSINCIFERNRIVFGAPGTGKSFQMEKDRIALESMGGGYERVTFHPDYTYSNFVGCYKPVSENGEIKYKYTPGPFMRVLVEALRSGLNDSPVKPFLLIIEEINRAKVAAVFGEVFQLLDRDKNGVSEYEIHTSEDVKKYLSEELQGSLESFDKIRIPNNMFIWASMNSADQGVFPMDTAFKRRWSFEYKGINANEDKVGGDIVLGKGEYELKVNWNILRKSINEVLTTTYHINEDKLLGPFFLEEDVFAFNDNGYIINPDRFIRTFKSKVLMYLYEDAAKQQKHKLFSGCDSSKYSSICEAFDNKGIYIFGTDFKQTYDDLR